MCGPNSAVQFSAMANFYDPDGQFIILNRVDDAITSLAKSILFLAGEFFAAGRTRICRETLYFYQNLS